MGSIPAAGGTTTSFSNTPQAKDDYYQYLEDVLREDSTLYNTSTNTLLLNVMSNDLGGNAKSLFSVEDGDGNPITTDYELIDKDVNALGVSNWEETLGHNWVRINNGKIEYRIADGSGIVGQGRSVDSLTAGEIFSDQFVYAIKLGNGTLSEATVKINITGANDVAVIGIDGLVPNDRAVVEAGGVANNSPGDPGASGRLTISDADLNQASFQAPLSLNGTYGTFTFNTATGAWVYTLENSRIATQALRQGEVVSDTLTVTSLDGGTTYPIVVTIAGANDAPVITAGNDTGSVGEDAVLIATGNLDSTDVDVGDDPTWSAGAATYGTAAIDPATGEWSYTLDNTLAAVQGLGEGDTLSDSFLVTVTDEDGLTDTVLVQLTITGDGDAPVINSNGGGAAASISVAENTSGVTTVTASDIDGPTVTYSIVGGADATKFAIDPSTGVLSFISAPDFETPSDGGTNNIYDVTVRASDGTLFDDQAIAVTVTDVIEGSPPTLKNDVWTLSDLTPLPAGTITPAWFLSNDTDPNADALFVTNVTGLPVGMTANYDGSGHLLSVTGSTPAAGGYVLTYTVTDGSSSTTATVTMTVLDTTSGSDTFTLDMNDYSYIDLLGGGDTINGDVILTGNAGADIFVGNNGNDTLNGGAGNDQLFGNENNDTLNGGAGNDVLDGGNNTDNLTGGAGTDTLTGGGGNDTFVLNSTAAADVDTITDYGSGDTINITAVLSVSTGTNVITGGYLRVTTTGLIQIDANGSATDGQVWTTIGNVNAAAGPYSVTYLSGGSSNTVNVSAVAPPIALDLDRDGEISFVGINAGALFDYGGGAVQTAWVAANDGLLVRDANHDGQVTADEIVFATTGSDLEGLAVYDTNLDGQLTSADQHFADFAVWQDADSDGSVDQGELRSLTAEGIASISLTSDGQSYSAAGGDVTVVGTGSFVRIDGSTGVLADAVFATSVRNPAEEARMNAATSTQFAVAAAVAASGMTWASAAAAHDVAPQLLMGDQLPLESADYIEKTPGDTAAQDGSTPLSRISGDLHGISEMGRTHARLDESSDPQVEREMLTDTRELAQLTESSDTFAHDAQPAGAFIHSMIQNLSGMEMLGALIEGASAGPAAAVSVSALLSDAAETNLTAILADAVDASNTIDAILDRLVGSSERDDHGANLAVTASPDHAAILSQLLETHDMGATMNFDLGHDDTLAQLATASA